MSQDNAPQATRPSKLKNLGKNLILIFISLFVALSICEVSLRFYNPLGFRIKGDNIILPVNKTEILYHDNPTKIGAVVVHHNNSLGFKGPEPPRDFANWLTVVTVGGSTTECLEIAEDKTWPHVLGVQLQHDFNKLWLDNAGFCGQSTYGHYILMHDFIDKLQPKVAVFLIGINEVGVSNPREFDTRMGTKISFRSLDKFLAALAYRSEVASAALNLYRYYFPKSVQAYGERKMGELDLTTLPTLQLTQAQKAALLKTHAEKYVPAYEARLRRLLTITEDHHIIPVLLTQPVVYGKAIDDETGLDLGKIVVANGMNGEVGWQVLELYNDVTRRVGAEEHLLVIDEAREMPKSSRDYYDLMHFSDAGAKVFADIAARHLSPYLAEKFSKFAKAPAAAAAQTAAAPSPDNLAR
ncbi:MAG: SGNH/GDSL hydrolase family protein [Desulfobaccales bacterium]